MQDDELRKIARKRVGFKRHLAVYIVIISFLGLVLYFSSRFFPWFLFPGVGWGMALIFHFLSAYGFMGDSLVIEREYQRLKSKITRMREKVKEKDEGLPIDNFKERKKIFVSRSEQMDRRGDDYFKGTREKRLVSSSLAIAWSGIFLIFFNFFHQYVAYYHYETVNHIGRWVNEPLLTERFNDVLPILSTTLVLSIIGNFMDILFDRYILRQAISVILHLFGLVTVLTFLFVFPFNFSVIVAPLAVRILSFLVPLAFIGIFIGLVIGMAIKAVKLIIALA